MAENTDNKQNDQKKELKALESDIKIAFKEGRFDDINALADKVRAIDPESHLVTKIFEKVAKTKEDMAKKEKAGRVKEYETMLKKLYKEKNVDNLKNLVKELRDYAPEEGKLAESWLQKAEKLELDAKREENAEKINGLQDAVKLAFKDGRFEDLRKSATELTKVDPDNKISVKFLTKAAKVEEKAEKAKAKEAEKFAKAEAKQKEKQENKQEIKKEVKEEGVKEKKESFFSSLFKKKEKKDEVEIKPLKEEVTPAMEVKAETKEVKPEAPVMPVEEIKVEKSESTPVKEMDIKETVDKGNVFTKMFKKKEAEVEKTQKSIIDTIVTQSSDKKEETLKKEKEVKEEKKRDAVGVLSFSKAFMQFSLAFIVLSATFFYVQNIDKTNTVLSLFGVEENYASSLHAANERLTDKMEEKESLEEEIDLYQKGYNTRYEEIIDSITEKRMNWPDILEKINEITDTVYERNAISQYIKYTGFSFNAETSQVTVSGTLSDPLGKNLTKLAELEEAFRYYPSDRNDTSVGTEPYFYNVREFTSLSKAYDNRTGKYTSNFQLSFTLDSEAEK